MKLLTLTLRNFKGVRDFTLDTSGGMDVDVFGDNATGKTTLADAFTWLLFGKDSHGRADFQIKGLQADGEPYHRLEHVVEGALEHDGRVVTLSRVYREKWTKQRGSPTESLTGHETEYLVDGVPMRKMDYDRVVSEIASEETFRLLTDPYHFHRLHWQDRRRVLVDLISDVSDDDVIASEKRLARLSSVLDGRTVDATRDVLDATRKRLNRELAELPVRIDEATTALPELEDERDDLLERLAAAKERVVTLRDEIASARSSSTATARDAVSAARAKLTEHRAIASEKRSASLVDYQNAHSAAASRLATSERAIESLASRRASLVSRLATMTEERDALRAEYATRHAEQYVEPREDDTCPCCGQSLPPERVTEARALSRSTWNAARATALTDIQTRGKTLAAEIEKLDHQLTDVNLGIVDAERERDDARVHVDERFAALESARNTTPMDDGDERALERAVADAEAHLLAVESGAKADTSALLESLAAAESTQREIEREIARHDAAEQLRERIDGLEKREREVTSEYERVVGDLDLLDLYLRAKAALLTQKINALFELAEFRLFREQINGGIEPTCETLVGGVSYDDLNHGSQINVGLDIIAALTTYHSFAAPVFVDNAEAVTRLFPVESQLIRLVVSEGDASLRVNVVSS